MAGEDLSHWPREGDGGFTRDGGEALEKFIQRVVRLEILEQSLHRNASPAKYGRALARQQGQAGEVTGMGGG